MMDTRTLGIISPESKKLERSQHSSDIANGLVEESDSRDPDQSFHLDPLEQRSQMSQSLKTYPTPITLYLGIDHAGNIQSRKVGQSPEDFPYFPMDILGKNLLKMLAPSLRHEFEVVLGEVLTHRKIVCREYQLDKDNPASWVEATLIPMGTEQIGILFSSIKPRKKIELAYAILIQEMMSIPQCSFFQNLAENIAIALNLSEVSISKLVKNQLQTLAWYSNGRLQDNFSYSYELTPCHVTLRQGHYHCPHSVQQHFPNDPALVEFNSESYVGIAIETASGERIGTIRGLSREPLGDINFATSILRIIGDKVATNLEKLNIDEQADQGHRMSREETRKLSTIEMKALGVEQNNEMADNHSQSVPEDNIRVEQRGNIQTELRDRPSPLKTYLTITELYLELEKRVEERTEELQQILQKADLANRSKSEFLAYMSHELRTPLNGILGYAQILERSEYLKERDQKGIAVIHKCGKHLLTLINDILDLSKIEANKLDFSPTPINLPGLLLEVIEICKIKVDSQRVKVLAEWPENLPQYVIVDDKRLRQILINLIGNAIKFTYSGTVKLRVLREDGESPQHKGTSQDLEQCRLRFEVEDDGIGISKASLSRMFNPFEQINAASHHTEGTGLGLAISQRLVNLMDSVIQASSEEGVGSCFSFALDLPIPQSELIASEMTGLKISGYEGPRKKILIINDQGENQSIISSLLEPIGFEIEILGTEKLELINQEKFPDLVIFDLDNPIMESNDLLEFIHQYPQSMDLTVIVSSVSIAPEVMEKSFFMGVHDFLIKPITPNCIFKVLEKYLLVKWIYTPATTPEPTDLNIDTDQIIPPSSEVLHHLLDLAQAGKLKKLIDATQHLTQTDSANLSFINRIITLAKEFKTEEVEALLYSCLEATE
jgi:signal transduction histidine kinase/DNA-binding NarL/FixJ family response regulator